MVVFIRFLPQGTVHIDHGQFDQVRGGALDRGVDGGAFGKLAHIAVAAGDVRQLSDTTQQGAGLPGVVGGQNGFVDKGLDAL
jgi:hypothetical protein